LIAYLLMALAVVAAVVLAIGFTVVVLL